MSRFGLYSNDSSGDRALLESLIRENNECFGIDTYFLPRTEVNLNKLFGEAMKDKFDSAHRMPLIMENPDGFGGGEQLYNKFGMNFSYADSLSIGMKHFQSITNLTQPQIGDIIFIPMMDKFFEITYVNNRTIFYQNGQLYVFRMDVQIFKYDGADIDTGVNEVDDNIPTTDSPFVEDDNDIVDDFIEKNDLISDWDEVNDTNDLD